jgi:tagatose-6-phosphate ketose/aldose isomerase
MTDLKTWHTWREIHAQPDIWEHFGADLLTQRDGLRAWIADSGATEVWFSGAGTSAYIGDFIAAALGTVSDLPLKSVPSTDLVSAPHQFLGKAKPLVVSFGRSGNSAETIGVLNVLDVLAPDAPRLNITCNAVSALATRNAANSRTIVLPDATHDQGFAMTSSYTTMLLTALTLFDPTPPADVFGRLSKALQAALPGFTALAHDMDLPARMVVTGSGALRYTAREAALKIMELTSGQTPVLWDSALGFRHGPKSFVAPNTHVLCFISQNPDIARYDRDLAAELRTQFADITVTEIAPTELPDTWGSVVQATAAQVIAAVLSARMGLNVDDPFAGQGTLTRVVADVTLYPLAVA